MEGPCQDEIVVSRKRRQARVEGPIVDETAGFIDDEEGVNDPS